MISWILNFVRRQGLVPALSETERIALEAGSVWVEAEFFSGKPDFRRMLAEAWPALDARERAFLDGPCEEACRRVDPWQVTRTRELPEEAWRFLRENGFFGMTVPAEFGGLGFSPLGVSAVIGKLATRSIPLSAVVLIPNSVGPAELIAHHGTEAQKRQWLPRLATGEEMPCFALTEPNAGSDAASIESSGTAFRAEDGAVRIRLDFSKRYITLAPIATLIGLAFRLRDPENLLGKGTEPGITVALVRASAPGVEIGRRHDPMGIPFPNGPIAGKDVVIAADEIIGGPEFAGRGWQMLMEALSAGRSISLPAQSAAGAKAVVRALGAYAAVRRQFGLPIGRFEGIEEPLARIGGMSYLLEAVRIYTCGAVTTGNKPSVASALVKVLETESARRIVLDAMDVAGGAALCRGPSNLLADGYIGAPIGITVEGANILTRTLIVFGQGALRCHPYAQAELRAVQEGNPEAFRSALLGHAGFVVRTFFRALALDLTRGWFARSPVKGPTARYFRRIAWASARFALLTDLAMALVGPKLKRKGKLTGRFADALTGMYSAVAVLRRWEADGRPAEDLPLVRWAAEHALAQAQQALEGILRNFEAPGVGWFLRGPVAWWVRANPLGHAPSDALGGQVAALIQRPGAQRDRLTDGIFRSNDPGERSTQLERALELAARAEPLWPRIREAARAGKIPAGAPETRIDDAARAGVLDAAEADLAREAWRLRETVVAVDSFTKEEYFGGRPGH